MQESEFWTLIEAVRGAAGNSCDARVVALQAQLEALPPHSIKAFQQHYYINMAKADRWDLWGAAYLMNGGCSDDGFHYFRSWLISEGERTFAAALAAPDSLADLPEQDYFELEEFGYVATKVYEAKTSSELEQDVRVMFALDTQGDEWEEDDLPGMFPRLAAKYGFL